MSDDHLTLLAMQAAAHVTAIDTVVILNVIILLLLAAVGIAIVMTRNIFAITMLGGAYSLLAATFFATVDAVDVAFTEAAVGAGMSTVLMLAALLLTAREARPVPRGRQWAALAVVIVTGAVLLYATPDTPRFGDPNSPANAYVGQLYIEATPKEIDVPNVVTAVLASYRGFDTFGEVVVVFTAGLGVMLILGLSTPVIGGFGRREDDAPSGPSTVRDEISDKSNTREPEA
jgi:multicomponent Na+:H+ antiporter subunit B